MYEEDIEDAVKNILQQLNLTREPEAINHWIKTHKL